MHSFSRTIFLTVCLVVLSGCTSKDLEEGEQDLVLKIGQLQPYGLSLPENFNLYESFTRTRQIDGTVSVEYEFQAPDELALPYLFSIAEQHSTASGACFSYSAGNFGLPLGLGDGELAVRDDLFKAGDKSRFGLLMTDGEVYGNYFGMCRGKTAFMVVLGGFYFDDGELWKELLDPTLDALNSMN